MEGPRGSVRAVRGVEVEAWCACPLREGDPRFAAWLAGERAWVSRWHPTTRNLFVFEGGDRFLGKYDVPEETPGRWTLWAPSAAAGDDAGDVLDALCRHVLQEARGRGIRDVEVLVEDSHRRRDQVVRSLRGAGFHFVEDRIVVERDLGEPLPPVPESGATYVPAGNLSPAALERLCRAAGATSEPCHAASGTVALDGGVPVGVALRTSPPGDETLTLQHLGIVPGARHRGHGRALLLAVLHRARAEGVRRYVGSTGRTNTTMLRLFEGIGCRVVGGRSVFGARP
ncbi:MAG: GNAT family N-acetyltransferase [Planctomycetota bacterium]|jgi:GNAT superfamily N-acetyltransferase